MRTINRVAIATLAAAFGSAGVLAQAPAGSGQPAPGAGNSTAITSANREANANYNHLVGAGDPKPLADGKPRAKRSSASPATVADIKAGSALRDSLGNRIGTVDSVDAEGVVVNTGQTKIKVPLMAFGKDDQGLLLGITAAKFNELVTKAHASN